MRIVLGDTSEECTWEIELLMVSTDLPKVYSDFSVFSFVDG